MSGRERVSRMLTRIQCCLCTLFICLVASTTLAQRTIAEFQEVLHQKAAFEATDFAALQLNQPVVRLAPSSDKSEIAVAGLVNINADAEEFLQSYRNSMMQKNNAAILEIGSFGHQLALTD